MVEILKKPELIHVGGSRGNLDVLRSSQDTLRFIIREGTEARAAIDIRLSSVPGLVLNICQAAGIPVTTSGKKELNQ